MALAAHFLERSAFNVPSRSRRPKLAAVLGHYAVHKGERIASITTFKMATRDLLEICGDITVSQFDVTMQVKFVDALRNRGNAGSTIQRKLGALRPAFTRAKGDGILSETPPAAGTDDWHPQIQTHGHDRALSIEEITLLFNTVPAVRDATPEERKRVTPRSTGGGSSC